jgi:hypothetical protein
MKKILMAACNPQFAAGLRGPFRGWRAWSVPAAKKIGRALKTINYDAKPVGYLFSSRHRS